MAGQGRKKLTDEEKALNKQKKQEEKAKEQIEIANKVLLFKESDYINHLGDDLIIDFLNVLNTKYEGMDEEDAIKLLFEGFISGCFEFEIKKSYGLPK